MANGPKLGSTALERFRHCQTFSWTALLESLVSDLIQHTLVEPLQGARPHLGHPQPTRHRHPLSARGLIFPHTFIGRRPWASPRGRGMQALPLASSQRAGSESLDAHPRRQTWG